jgi:hypothetical protein
MQFAFFPRAKSNIKSQVPQIILGIRNNHWLEIISTTDV